MNCFQKVLAATGLDGNCQDDGGDIAYLVCPLWRIRKWPSARLGCADSARVSAGRHVSEQRFPGSGPSPLDLHRLRLRPRCPLPSRLLRLLVPSAW